MSAFTTDSLLADKAVFEERDDSFQRYPFARHLATTICERRSTDSLVIGLYGKWGAGKSSVLNFVQAELAHTDVLTVYFNPWRFDGEEQLLLGFFAELSVALEAVVTPAARQAAQEALAKYAKKLVTKLHLLNRAASGGESKDFKPQDRLEGVKQEINELLRNSNKRVLVLIDDIDRLSAHEIHAILRLVKLTGDFHYTTYLLAFDEKVVAQAIGEQYAGGSKQAGQRYLEKIIQVPLHLPIIQKEAMKKYFQEGFSRSLFLTNTQLSDGDYQRLVSVLATSILPRVTTPRHVTRYSNTLLVILPLLKGEANMVDLMLLEALKQFYPKLYKLVSRNQHLLTGTEFSTAVRDIKVKYDPVFGPNGAYIGGALYLLNSLFPKLEKVYGGTMFSSLRSATEDTLYNYQAVASTYYFRRYFSYAVQEGEIPDADFNSFVAVMDKNELGQGVHLAKQMIARSSDREFTRRLELNADQVPPARATIYCELLIMLQEDFSAAVISERAMRRMTIMTKLYLSYIKLLPIEEANEYIGLILIRIHFTLAFELFFDITRIWHQSSDHILSKLIAQTNYDNFCRIIVSRGLHEAGEMPWYEAFAQAAPFFLRTWTRVEGKQPAQDSLRNIFTANPTAINTFLQNISPLGRLNGELTYANVNQETYNLLKEHLDLEYLYRIASSLIESEEPLPYRGEDVFHQPEPTERLHQLVYLYKEDKSEATSATSEAE